MTSNEQRSSSNSSSRVKAAGNDSPNGSKSSPVETAEALASLLDQYLADLEAGRQPDRNQLLASHPELGAQLEEALAGLEFIHSARTSPGAAAPASRLGDFQLVREVGRGGMGVVYEAEQISLKRRVALKVLSTGAAVDEVAMQRFQREAETVATLHHTNIVPIFAVGCERGVRYYAMQFIRGRNLAEVAGLNRAEGKPPLDCREVAQWGLQAAEAIAHAHQRGVIHRDIKPSNLILDEDGRIWLTDFGLARRLEDVTLSLTGALLGTPRYMSPEQAGAATNPIDHRTDIYSLGATLYELVTGKPIFDATTPQAVLNQILTTDPLPPRRLNPDLPRDLETIIIKCLVKEPGQRYGTARALAEDLRAFLENRSIKARRAGLPVQALRWARKHRRSTTVAAISAAASVALLGAVLTGSRLYWEQRQARLSLLTAEPLLQAEILEPGQERPEQPAFSLPTRQAVKIAPGEHEVRLSAPGVLSETHLLGMKPRSEMSFDVTLQKRALLNPFNVEGGKVELLSLGDGPADFIVFRGSELQRIDAASGAVVWGVNVSPNEVTNVFRKEVERSVWIYSFEKLLRPAPDLDGDKVGDVVWASTDVAGVIAFSGKTGRLLWFHCGEDPERPAGASAGGFTIYRNLDAGAPGVGDLDGDGVPDLAALMTAQAKRWVQAISGKTGEKLWARSLDPQWLKPFTRTGHEVLPSPEVVTVGGRPIVCVAASTQLLLLEGKDGAVLHQQDLHATTIQQLRVADLNGDDQPDVLILGERNERQRVLIAYSLSPKKELWQQPVGAPFEPYQSTTKQIDWPVTADLDHDGKTEVLMPGGSFHAGPFGHMRTDHWCGVEVLSGETGLPRWQRALARGRTASIMEPILHFTIAKDLDADGYDDLYVASLYRRSFNQGDTFLCVDALSGKSGASLWSWNLPQEAQHDKVSPVTSWSLPGGAPLLAVWSMGSPRSSRAAYLLDGASGELRHILPETFHFETAECDGDGVPDLAFRTTTSPELPMGLARQHVIRGLVSRHWSRLADAMRFRGATPDVDGDGTEDVLLTDPPELLSGRTGSQLWRSSIGANRAVLLKEPAGDLDRDGVPEILAFQENVTQAKGRLPLTAISGRTGNNLWTSPVKSRGSGKLLFAGAAELRDKEQVDLLAAVELNITVQRDPLIVPQRSNQVFLLAFDARDGVERWRQPLTRGYEGAGQLNALPGAIADLDGDGLAEVLMGAVNLTNGWELRAYSGKDGTVLWAHALDTDYSNLFNLFRKVPAPVVADLDRDGLPEVLLGHDQRLPVPGQNGRWWERTVLVLDGRTGELRWAHAWQDHSDQYPAAPLVVRLGNGLGTGVCIAEGRFQETELVLFNARGAEIERRKVALQHWPAQLQVADLDANGVDEILFIRNDGNVEVTTGGLRTRLWEAPADALTQILAPVQGGAPTVIAARYQELHGLSGKTGEPLWVTHSSGQRFGYPVALRGGEHSAPLIAAPGPWRPDAPGTGTIVCYGVRLTSAGEGLAAGRQVAGIHTTPMPAPARAEAASRLASTGRIDPRLARSLPWNVLDPGFGPQNRGPLHEFVIPEALLGLGLMLGLVLAGASWRGWSWKVGIPFLVCVLVAVGIGTEAIRPRHLPHTWFVVVLSRGVLMLPYALLAASLVLAISRRAWREAGILGGFTLVAAAVSGVLWLLLDQRTLVEGEYYTWTGWYFIVAAGAYLVGLTIPFAWGWKAARARWLSMRRTQPETEPTHVAPV